MSAAERTAGRRTLAGLSSICAVGMLCAPMAGAEPDEGFDHGIASVRAAGSCAALIRDPLAQKVAEISNRSTEDYLNHTARHVPVADPLAVLKDFGSDAGKAVQLQGYGRTDAAAIKGALLQGHTALPDCSYTTFGSSLIRNPERGQVLAVAVLAGP
ncbi:hypothetical protein FR943_01685 [Mycobacterium sp. TNTM28]|uniref:CAP domain-containing protein n=1 Tax=[Mycobacterium] fortunisiensis TaxID=2600579 RepID=A0ABS6KG68_9MYCO|nr:hypothetical protein [[Mycobacterium] fortunisiensis]MBU9762564.1 hypothetical protein [[Mycobacterium] fortunisiensis]